MKRRTFISLFGGAAVSSWTSPFPAFAQTLNKPPRRIGVLGGSSPAASAKLTAAFEEGMRAQGYIEGRDYKREFGWAEGHLERLPGLAEQMVHSRIDVILAGIVQAAVAASGATKTVPIVCPMLADPVRLGLIKSDARRGGNLTGIRLEVEGLPGKQLELVLDLIPRATKIGLLLNPDNDSSLTQRRELEIAVAAKAIKIVTMRRDRPERLTQSSRPSPTSGSMRSSCCRTRCSTASADDWLRRPWRRDCRPCTGSASTSKTAA